MDLSILFKNATPANPDNLNQNEHSWTYSLAIVDDLNDQPISQAFTLAADGSLTVPLTLSDLFKTNITITCGLLDIGNSTQNPSSLVVSVTPNPTEVSVVIPIAPIFTFEITPPNAITVSATLE